MAISRRGFLKGVGAAIGVAAAAKYLPAESLLPSPKPSQAFNLKYVIKAKPPVGNGVPAGTVFTVAGEVPDGWILCDGQRLSKYRFPTLYNVIGDTYGSTPLTFSVPDLRGKFANVSSVPIVSAERRGSRSAEARKAKSRNSSDFELSGGPVRWVA